MTVVVAIVFGVVGFVTGVVAFVSGVVGSVTDVVALVTSVVGSVIGVVAFVTVVVDFVTCKVLHSAMEKHSHGLALFVRAANVPTGA